MKWCFLLNEVPELMKLLGELAFQAIKEGDECIVVMNSKIAEFDNKKFFPQNVKFISKIDWCIKNYKKTQKEFNDLSWEEFFPTFDRKTKQKVFKFNNNNSVEIISQLYQFFDDIFYKEKPDVVINEAPANAFTQIAYKLCKKYSITYLGLMASRFKGRIDVYDLKHTYSKYQQDFEKLSIKDISSSEKQFAKEFINNFISHKQLPSGAEDPLLYFHKVNLLKYYTKRIREIYHSRLQYLKSKKKFKQFDYESEAILRSTFQAPLNAIQRKIRYFFQKNIFDHPTQGDKYFLFPLHFQPEASTSVLATYFSDQLTTIKNIAFCLPFPYKLYVKEHPTAVGTHSGKFYKEIKKIPNVVLISPDENVENLVKNSQGVITLTSTIGMESALSGKPVYILGNVFYSYHPLCRKVNTFEDLKEKIKQDLIQKPDLDDLEEKNIKFIISYYKNTIPGDIIGAGKNNDANDYKMIYRSIKEMFKTRVYVEYD
jgi:hypothetical protein